MFRPCVHTRNFDSVFKKIIFTPKKKKYIQCKYETQGEKSREVRSWLKTGYIVLHRIMPFVGKGKWRRSEEYCCLWYR
jgi:hypothetical protein